MRAGYPDLLQTPIRGRGLNGRFRAVLRRAALTLAVVGPLALWVWMQGSERRAITRLPESERAELFRNELESFNNLCGQGPRTDALEGKCREKAEFLLAFPECDPACQELLRSHLFVSKR